MGTIIEVKCDKCGYKKDLFIGGGLNDWDIKNAISEFSGENFKKLYQEFIISRHNLDIFKFNRYIATCISCKELYVVPVIDFETDNKRKHEIVGRCPTCNDRVDICKNNNIETIKINCPKCNNKINILEVGSWD